MKIFEAEINLQAMASIMQEKMPRKASMAVAKNLRKYNDELKEYFEQKNELVRKYGKEVDGQYIIEESSDNFKQFLEEIRPLANAEIDIDTMKVTYDELPETISPEALLGLEFMIEG